MAAEARIMSAVMASRRLLNALNSPERTSTAPTSSIGAPSSPVAAKRPKSTRRSSMCRNSASAVSDVGVSYGLTAGSTTRFSSLAAHTTQALTSCSSGVVAELSAQNSSSSPPAAAGSPSSSADQASRAHTAPARGAAEADNLVAGQLLGPEQPLEHPGGEGGVAAAALAGDGHPGSSRIGHRPHPTGAVVCSAPAVVTEQSRHSGREVDGERYRDGHHRDEDPRAPGPAAWARWHWLIVIGLGTVWVLDGLESPSSARSRPD